MFNSKLGIAAVYTLMVSVAEANTHERLYSMPQSFIGSKEPLTFPLIQSTGWHKRSYRTKAQRKVIAKKGAGQQRHPNNLHDCYGAFIVWEKNHA